LQRRAEASASADTRDTRVHALPLQCCMGVHAAKRLPGFSYVGESEYSITCCTFNRHRCFTEATVVDAVRVQLLHIATEQQFDIPAYCFMPDHVHVLATGRSDGSDLRRFLKDWKQQTGHAYKQAAHIKLWQGGFYDHVLRAEEDRAAVVRYLLENPIRAGLVRNLLEYPYWGSGLCSREELLEVLYDRNEYPRVRAR
jgi:putative transposase